MDISLISIVAFVVILGVMIIGHELGHFITAKMAGIRVDEFAFGFPPRLFGIRRGETLYSVNLVPLGGYVKMMGEEDPTHERSFARARKTWRVVVLVAGPAMNLILAVALFTTSFMAGWPTPVSSEIVVAAVVAGSPAERAQLHAGDVIVDVAGKPVGSMQQIRDTAMANAGNAFPLVVRRDGALLTVSVEPRGSGANYGTIGVQLGQRATRVEPVSYPLPTALVRGAQQTAEVVGLTFYIPVLALRGQVPAESARPVGPVGIFDVVNQATNATVSNSWWFPLLSTMALISAGLGIANLLPIPGLDGGRLVFVVLEAIRRKRVSPERESMIHFVGIAFLLSLVLVVSYFDVLAPIGTINWGGQ